MQPSLRNESIFAQGKGTKDVTISIVGFCVTLCEFVRIIKVLNICRNRADIKFVQPEACVKRQTIACVS